MARYITCISGKGGVGKSTTAMNLAAALNLHGKDTTLIDANFTTPNIGIYLGVPILPKTIHEVLSNKSSIENATYIHKSGTKVVPGNISLASLDNVKPQMFKNRIKSLDKKNDFVIIDAAAGLGREALASLEAGNEIIVVTSDELPGVADALKTVRVAQELKKEVLGVVVNRQKDKGMSTQDIEEMLELPVIATIPEDEKMREALDMRDAIVNTHPTSKAAYAYKKLASYVTGDPFYEEPAEQPKEGKSIIMKLLDAFGLT